MSEALALSSRAAGPFGWAAGPEVPHDVRSGAPPRKMLNPEGTRTIRVPEGIASAWTAFFYIMGSRTVCMDLGIDGNAALVTAGTAGLGLASAEALAKGGADVAVCGRDGDRLDRAEGRLSAVGDGDVRAVRADITEPDDIEAFVGSTVEAFGRLDHVVTSAGGPPSGPFLDTDDGDWYDAYDLLVMSVVRTIRTAHPALSADGGGTVVTITSRTVKEVLEGLVLSNAVRRAVLGLTKSLADEFAPEIRVNTVLPGPHETDRIEELIEADVERGEYGSYEAGLGAWADDVPLERVGDPRELGDTVAWLSSERSSYVDGAAVPVDGGSMRGI